MIFVTGRTKRSVDDHFDTAYELETELEMAGKTALLEVPPGIATDDSCAPLCTPAARPGPGPRGAVRQGTGGRRAFCGAVGAARAHPALRHCERQRGERRHGQCDRHHRKTRPRGGPEHPGRGGARNPHAGHLPLAGEHPARGGWRDPSDRRHLPAIAS